MCASLARKEGWHFEESQVAAEDLRPLSANQWLTNAPGEDLLTAVQQGLTDLCCGLGCFSSSTTQILRVCVTQNLSEPDFCFIGDFPTRRVGQAAN